MSGFFDTIDNVISNGFQVVDDVGTAMAANNKPPAGADTATKTVAANSQTSAAKTVSGITLPTNTVLLAIAGGLALFLILKRM
jgi:hypothetical protein